MSSQPTPKPNCRGIESWTDLLKILVARKWFLLFYTLGVLIAAYLAVQLMTERYQATASLLVRLGRENAGMPVTVDRGLFTSLGVREEEINANIQLLKSRILMEETVDLLGVEAFERVPAQQATLGDKIKSSAKGIVRWTRQTLREALIGANLSERLSQREKTVDYCSKFFRVEHVKNSDAIELNLQHPKRELTVQILDTLISRYREHHVQARRNVVTQDFFSDRVEEYAKQLEHIDLQILDLREQQGLSSIDTQRDLLLEKLSRLSEKLEDNLQDTAFLEKSRGPEPQRDGNVHFALATSTKVLPDRSVERLKSHATKLHMELIQLQAVENANSAGYETVEQQIDSVQGLLGSGLGERRVQLEEMIDHHQVKLQQLNAAQISLERLERNRELLKQSYFAFSKRREEARVSEELDQARALNVAILAAPSVSYVPVYPKKLLVMTAAIIVGGLSGLAWVVFPHTQALRRWPVDE